MKRFKRIKIDRWLILLFILTSNVISAQNLSSDEIIETKSNTYKSRKLLFGISIENIQNENNTKGLNIYNPEIYEFSWVKIKSHDDFLNVFNVAFSKERIELLAKKNERIIISCKVDEKANIIVTSFILDINTQITIEEIEKLEHNLIKKVNFEVVGKKFTEPIYYDWSIRVFFKEVEKGEIEFARKSESYKGN